MSETKLEVVKKENPYLITFSKPYTFEGKEYATVDLSGLENMTANDLFEANRAMAMEYISPKPEADAKFCCTLAGLACGLPIEFFERLPIKEGLNVRNVVQGFFRVTG